MELLQYPQFKFLCNKLKNMSLIIKKNTTFEIPKQGGSFLPSDWFIIVKRDSPNVVCLIRDKQCIYPDINCQPPYNFIASKNFVNPYNQSAVVTITGNVDDDALLIYGGSQLWLRSQSSSVPSCVAGAVNHQFTIGASESFIIEGWDTRGICGEINICVSFALSTP